MVGETIFITTRVGDLMKSKKTKIFDIIILVLLNIHLGYKDHVIYFIAFAFVVGFTIIDWLSNMKLCVMYIVQLYEDKIISSLGTSGKMFSIFL